MKLKRSRSFLAGNLEKIIKKAPTEPATVTVVLNDKEKASDEEASFQRRSSLAQPDAQPRELQNPSTEEVRALWGEMGLVENADSHFSIPVDVLDMRISAPDLSLSPTIDPSSITVPSILPATLPSTPTSSYPSTPLFLCHQYQMHHLYR